jgi:NADH-quinone oxidoreductase subunit J
MEQVLFVVFGAVALAASVMAITRKNAVASAVWLVGTFFGLAGTFVLLEAYFVAVVQILVYAGAIMVLFLFVIMLLDLKSADLAGAGRPPFRLAGVVLSALFLFVVGRAVLDAKEAPGAVAPRASALLRLPAPPPAESDPLSPGAVAAAPPPAPTPVPLSRREPGAIALDEALRASLSRRRGAAGGGPDAWGEPASGSGARPRAFAGSVRVGDSTRVLVVELARAGTGKDAVWATSRAFADQDGDGVVEASEALPQLVAETPLPPARPPEDHEHVVASVTYYGTKLEYDASFVAPGARLEVAVAQKGLAAAPDGAPDGSPFAIGKSLFDDWILAFEVTSLLLLGAIFGAVVLTKRRLA